MSADNFNKIQHDKEEFKIIYEKNGDFIGISLSWILSLAP